MGGQRAHVGCLNTHAQKEKGKGHKIGNRQKKTQASGKQSQSQEDTYSEELMTSLRECGCVETLRNSRWDLRDTGHGVMSLRTPESGLGTAEAQP